MTQHERPLSPFMHYRWQYTNTLSILHRLTGIFMSLGMVLLVYWLVAAASGSNAYDAAINVFALLPVKVILFGLLLSFYFHLFNGIRHLGWDMGWGFERATAKKTGWLVFSCAVVVTVLTWICITAHISATVNGALT